MTAFPGYRLVKEMRRRRVFRTAGLYVVGAWLVMQAADVLFPGWGVPEEAIRYLFLAALLGFPVALVFGWIFEITPEGVRRTRSEWSEAELDAAMPLRRVDYVILSVFVVVVGLLIYDATIRVLRTAALEETPGVVEEFMENSVAVLPFTNLSPDPEHEYFADAISEEILNRLSAFGELTVIARTSSFSFKDSGYDIARISGLLGVEYLLQGSVQRDDGEIRIAAQLVDNQGIQLWTQTFDRELGRIFALQDEIAESVATSIVPQISPSPAADRLPDLEAYQQYLLGREIMARRSELWFRHGPERFTRAIELDPEFADAYAARAVGLVVGAQLADDYEAQLELAQRDIDTALTLNPNLAQAYAAQALLNQFRTQPDAAEEEALLRRALALDPNLVNALNWLAGTLFQQGRPEEAIEFYHRALRINPLDPTINVNLAMEEARRGRFDEAERRLLRLLEVPQPSSRIDYVLSPLQRTTGRIVEAIQSGKRRVLQTSPSQGRAFGSWILVLPYGLLGQREQAEYWQARAEQEWPESYQVHLWRATLLGHATGLLGYDEAVAVFEAVLQRTGVQPEKLPPGSLTAYGTLLALAGDHESALRVFEPLIDLDVALQATLGDISHSETDARHALAWAYQQTGAPEKAAAVLEKLAQHFQEERAAGRLHLSNEIFEFARNTLLLGDAERALELLEQAAEAGWRGYYPIQQDPRWDAVRDVPKFREIMARVKVDIDRQRAEVEAIDAVDDFAARLDAAIAARQAEVARP